MKMYCFLILLYLFYLKVSSEDSDNSEANESGISEEVSESEDDQRPRTR